MKKDWFDIGMAIFIIFFIVVVFISFAVVIYGVLTGKVSAESIDTENIWFWLFLLK